MFEIIIWTRKYEIEKLSDIADKLNIQLEKLMKWNKVQHDGLIKPKTKIIKVNAEQYK